jgi:hypothetical protein
MVATTKIAINTSSCSKSLFDNFAEKAGYRRELEENRPNKQNKKEQMRRS